MFSNKWILLGDLIRNTYTRLLSFHFKRFWRISIHVFASILQYLAAQFTSIILFVIFLIELLQHLSYWTFKALPIKIKLRMTRFFNCTQISLVFHYKLENLIHISYFLCRFDYILMTSGHSPTCCEPFLLQIYW